MASFDRSRIVDLGTTPIPGGEPCGKDAGDDLQYIAVTSELAKLDRIESDDPDWYQMEQDAIAILTSTSKDVEVASALGHTLFKLHGYAGLEAALSLFCALIENYWDGLYPSRPRRRKARIESLADCFTDGEWFRQNQPKPDDFDALDECIKANERLTALLTEKMPDDAPELGKFARGLKDHAAKRPKPEAPPPAAAPAADGAPAAAGAASAPSGDAAAFAAGEVSDAAGAINAILAAGTFLRQADATDPIAYAVPRLIKWAKISLPTSDEGKFKNPPPDASKVDALQHQMSNGLWDHLLKGAESAFRSSDPLWLDLQRYTCAALAGQGKPFDNARQTVMSLTAGLVKRLGEGLFELQFRTGQLMCSGETKMWIESEVIGADGGGGGGGGGSAAGDGRLLEASDTARKLAGSGKLKEAVQALQDGLVTCGQRRDRFLWRLRIAQLCFDAQRLKLAAPLLEECSDEIRQYRIDEWEPTLAAEVAQALYRCRKALFAAEKQPPPESAKGVRESYAWLCQLDPLAALAAEPSGK